MPVVRSSATMGNRRSALIFLKPELYSLAFLRDTVPLAAEPASMIEAVRPTVVAGHKSVSLFGQ
jgi:hypothetical protein